MTITPYVSPTGLGTATAASSGKQHPHAHILQAIAEDKDTEVEYLHPQIGWENTPNLSVLQSPDFKYRIKPKPFIINGVECPRPRESRGFCGASTTPSLTIIKTHTFGAPYQHKIYFATDADLMKVFDALVKPFEESKL